MFVRKIRAAGPGDTSLSEARAAFDGAIAGLRILVEPSKLARLDEVEAAIWPMLLALGRALLGLWLVHRIAAERESIVGQRGDPDGTRRTMLRSKDAHMAPE